MHKLVKNLIFSFVVFTLAISVNWFSPVVAKGGNFELVIVTHCPGTVTSGSFVSVDFTLKGVKNGIPPYPTIKIRKLGVMYFAPDSLSGQPVAYGPFVQDVEWNIRGGKQDVNATIGPINSNIASGGMVTFLFFFIDKNGDTVGDGTCMTSSS